MRTRELIVAVLMVAGVGCVSACSTSPTRDPLPAAGPTAQLTAALDLATGSGQWAHQQTRVDEKMRRVTDACMVRAGHTPPGTPPALVGWDETGAVDLEQRHQVGYGLDPDREVTDAEQHGSDGPDITATLDGAARDKYLEDLLGSAGPLISVKLPDGREIQTPRTGCVADGRRAVFGSIENWATSNYVPEALATVVSAKIDTAPAYISALDAWRSCMTAKGFPAQTPAELVGALERDYAAGVARTSEREITVAVADGTCALDSHLPGTALEVRRHLLATDLDPAQSELLTKATTLWLAAANGAATKDASTH